MVCVPCIIIPFLIWVFHKFVQPWLSKFWKKPEEMVNKVEANLVCPMPVKKKKPTSSDESKNSEEIGELKEKQDLGERLKAE